MANDDDEKKAKNDLLTRAAGAARDQGIVAVSGVAGAGLAGWLLGPGLAPAGAVTGASVARGLLEYVKGVFGAKAERRVEAFAAEAVTVLEALAAPTTAAERETIDDALFHAYRSLSSPVDAPSSKHCSRASSPALRRSASSSVPIPLAMAMRVSRSPHPSTGSSAIATTRTSRARTRRGSRSYSRCSRVRESSLGRRPCPRWTLRLPATWLPRTCWSGCQSSSRASRLRRSPPSLASSRPGHVASGAPAAPQARFARGVAGRHPSSPRAAGRTHHGRDR